MYDIIADKKCVAAAKQKGYDTLLIGQEVALVSSRSQMSKTEHIIVLGTKPDRNLLEAPIDGVVGIEDFHKKDHFHFRRGGLDQVLCAILAKEKKAYLVSFSQIKNSKDPARTIGRVLQNIKIAAKAKMPIIFASFATKNNEVLGKHDLEAFFRAIGVPSHIIGANQKTFSSWFLRAKIRASDKYIAEGVYYADSKE